MPLSIDEASKRFESYSQNIQDSILVIESFMGSQESMSFNLPQAITNLDSININTEERNVAAQIKVLEEYQRILATERKRRSIKQVIDDKMKSADFKSDLKKARRSGRMGQFKPNVLAAMAAAGQVPMKQPTTSQMPVPQPTTSQMPMKQPTTSQMSRPYLQQKPTVEEIEPNAEDELMLEF